MARIGVLTLSSFLESHDRIPCNPHLLKVSRDSMHESLPGLHQVSVFSVRNEKVPAPVKKPELTTGGGGDPVRWPRDTSIRKSWH
jgi:hypothetical protein